MSFLTAPDSHFPAYLPDELAGGLIAPSCPQEHRCWGPWVLDTADPVLYDTGAAHHAQIPLVQVGAGEKTMNVAAETLAFLVHFQWAGRQVTGGLLNAYTAIFGLRDYGPGLAEMRFTAAQVRKLARTAVDDPANVLHVRSLADVERADSHFAELARKKEHAAL